MSYPQGVPDTATVLRPTPFFWDTRDATVLAVASIVTRDNARQYGHFANRMNDWQTNDAIYKSLGMPSPPAPAPPDYEVLIAVWADNNNVVQAVAVSAPGADPKLQAIVPAALPPLPKDLTAYMWQVTVNQSRLTATGTKSFLDPSLQKLLPPWVRSGSADSMAQKG